MLLDVLFCVANVRLEIFQEIDVQFVHEKLVLRVGELVEPVQNEAMLTKRFGPDCLGVSIEKFLDAIG